MNALLPADALAPVLVAAGAVPGAWLRFALVQHLAPRLPRRPWATLVVNSLACLVLGALMARLHGAQNPAQPLLLLVATGFLGSFSTFSTLMVELLDELLQRRPGQALRLLLLSLAAGWLALRLGRLLGS